MMLGLKTTRVSKGVPGSHSKHASWFLESLSELKCVGQFNDLFRATHSIGSDPYIVCDITTEKPCLHMMASSNGNIFWPYVRGIHRWPVNFPAQRPVTRNFDVFFDLRINKRLSNQSWGWWFQMPSWSLWRHCIEMSGCPRYEWRPTIRSSGWFQL